MCLDIVRIRTLEARIRRLERDIPFEEDQIEIMGESKSIEKKKAKLDRLQKKLVDLQCNIDVPSCFS